MFFFKTFLSFWTGKEYRFFLLGLIIILFFQIALITYSYDNLPPQIPLYQSRQWGEVRLADTSQIIIIPLLCAISTILNTLLSAVIMLKEKTLTRLLLHLSLLQNSLGLFIIFQIIRLVQ